MAATIQDRARGMEPRDSRVCWQARTFFNTVSGVRFCPQCGAPVVSSARFCVECGANLAVLAAEANLEGVTPPPERTAPSGPQPAHTIGAFFAVFGAILAAGIAVAVVILRQQPAREALLASAPPAPPPSSTDQSGRQLPRGHPKVELPKEARDFIAQTEAKAHANPRDLTSWDRLGDVALRAAMFDAAYYAKAADAYAHVLKLDPDNLDALRGVGNLDFDQRKYDQSIAAYEHYLDKKPDDPDVRTDLGTMYLSTGAADQAVTQYRHVLASHPDFFEANFNLGIAYGEMNNAAGARAELEKALKLAPSAEARNRVNQMLASLNNPAVAGAPAPSSEARPSTEIASGGSGNAPGVNTFRGAMEEMLRDLPIAGPKVASVQWPSETKARVLMDNFPMDQMPPFAQHKFISDLKSGINQVKQTHRINGAVEVDICDAASGNVMQSVTE
jgi:tetratricopeptide (TPR) repeat protein